MKPTDPTPAPQSKKVFDVMRPGRAPASATSKPVIVSTAPPVQDTQFSAPTPKPAPMQPAAASVPELNSVVAELDPQAAKPVDNTPSDILPEDIAKGRVDQPAPDINPAPVIQDKPPQKEKPAEDKAPIDEEEADIGKAALDASMVQEVKAEEVAQVFEPQEMVISQGHRPKHSVLLEVTVILLAVILLVVIVNLLLDMDIIKLDTIPHTNFL